MKDYVDLDYEKIREAVQFDFEEYIDSDGMTVLQAVLEIIEEDYRRINRNPFIQYSYFIRIGIESLQRSELADFIHERLLLINQIILDIDDKEIERLKNDVMVYNEMLETVPYKLVETNYSVKSRVAYNLSITS
ncbi:hypothetical protein [Enterococcus sp. LJL51]|uniref:hypothetical protein n=1 Tax=Enterococcus sp. LJL51 TaxID=3416656 RepID=UPI003CF96F18